MTGIGDLAKGESPDSLAAALHTLAEAGRRGSEAIVALIAAMDGLSEETS